MTGKGLPIIQEYIYDKNPQLTLQAGSQALNYFLSLPAAPTAIICCNDIIALGALNAAYSLDNGESFSCHCFYVAILSGNNRIHGCFTADKGNFSVPEIVKVVHNWLHHLPVVGTYA